MADTHAPAELKALQDAIYQDRVLRARKLTTEERLAEALELTNNVFVRMHEGAMWQMHTTDSELGWQEVRRRLDLLGRVHEEGRFVSAKPAGV